MAIAVAGEWVDLAVAVGVGVESGNTPSGWGFPLPRCVESGNTPSGWGFPLPRLLGDEADDVEEEEYVGAAESVETIGDFRGGAGLPVTSVYTSAGTSTMIQCHCLPWVNPSRSIMRSSVMTASGSLSNSASSRMKPIIANTS